MAGRATLSYFQTVLDENWHEDINGRVEPVPKPLIRVGNDEDLTRIDQLDTDIVFITDGGAQSLSPKGAGWEHRGVEDLVSIDVRTKRGRSRLRGTRTEDNEPERYGGLRGEIHRILDSIRKGDQEFDLINGFEWNGLSGEMGYQFYRGSFEVRLTRVAEEIDPEP